MGYNENNKMSSLNIYSEDKMLSLFIAKSTDFKFEFVTYSEYCFKIVLAITKT